MEINGGSPFAFLEISDTGGSDERIVARNCDDPSYTVPLQVPGVRFVNGAEV
jgi:hypothetical protein